MFYSDSYCFNCNQRKKLVIYDQKRLKGSFLSSYTDVNNQSGSLLLGPPVRTVTSCWGEFRILNTEFVYLYQTNTLNRVYGITKKQQILLTDGPEKVSIHLLTTVDSQRHWCITGHWSPVSLMWV